MNYAISNIKEIPALFCFEDNASGHDKYRDPSFASKFDLLRNCYLQLLNSGILSGGAA